MKTWEKVALFVVLIVLATASIIGVVQSSQAKDTACSLQHLRDATRAFTIPDVYAPLPVPQSGDPGTISDVIAENARRAKRLAEYERRFPVTPCK